jgi:hypothetical protein
MSSLNASTIAPDYDSGFAPPMKSITVCPLLAGLGSLPPASSSAPVLGSDPRPSRQGDVSISSDAPILSLSHFKPETILLRLHAGKLLSDFRHSVVQLSRNAGTATSRNQSVRIPGNLFSICASNAAKPMSSSPTRQKLSVPSQQNPKQISSIEKRSRLNAATSVTEAQ